MTKFRHKSIHDLSLEFSNELHEGNTMAYHHARDVLEWLFSKPLTERLTEKEAVKIKQMYAATHPDNIDQSLSGIKVQHTLIDI